MSGGCPEVTANMHFPGDERRPAGGSGTQGVPGPTGMDAEDVIAKLEQIRATLAGIAEWANNEWNGNGFHAKILMGLVSQAKVRPEAARAVSDDMVRLLQRLNDFCLSGASTSKVLATKVDKFYIEEIHNNRRSATRRRANGLKVN